MIVLSDHARVFAAVQRFGLVLFLGFTVGYGLTGHVLFGFVGLACAVVAVAFSVKPGGLVAALRSAGTGLAEVGLVSLFLDLLHIRVLFIDLETAYWITLIGLLLNILLLMFEED